MHRLVILIIVLFWIEGCRGPRAEAERPQSAATCSDRIAALIRKTPYYKTRLAPESPAFDSSLRFLVEPQDEDEVVRVEAYFENDVGGGVNASPWDWYTIDTRDPKVFIEDVAEDTLLPIEFDTSMLLKILDDCYGSIHK